MSDSKKAFKQIRDLSRTAALAGHDEATRQREVFFTSLGYEAINRALALSEANVRTGPVLASMHLGLAGRYRDAIATLPDSCLEQSTFLGWAYQVWNEPIRDAHSWAVSKKAEDRHEHVDIAAVTQVFTDQYLADFLVSRCVDLWWTSLGRDGIAPRVCDPALGAGHILISAVRALVVRGVPVNAVADLLFGFDIDPLSVFVARVAVFCELVRSGYSEEPAALWEKLDCALKVIPAPHGSLDRMSYLNAQSVDFDIVVTNPPYLGRRKLPSVFRDFLDREYPASSMDLCAAFLQRCVELLPAGGMLGVVTSDKWIRLQRYATVRKGGAGFKGVFGELTIDGMYELGERAFSTVSDLHDGMRAALLVGCKRPPQPGHQLSYVTLAELSSCEEKQEALNALLTKGASSGHVTRVLQSELANGGAVFLKVSGLPPRLSKMARRLSDHAEIVVGVQTNDDARFVRYVWQVPLDRSGWRIHSKGGGYGRWAGLNRWVIDWREGAEGFFGRDSARERAESWAARDGWVYSWFANGSLGLRRKEAGWAFGRAASGGVFTGDQRVVAFMNSRLASAVARSVGGKIQLPEGTVKAIPAPGTFEAINDELVTSAVALKQTIIASDPTEALFCPESMREIDELLLYEAVLLVVEGVLEEQVERSIGLTGEERVALVSRLGMVAGWYSSEVGLANHPVMERLPQQWRDVVSRCCTQSLDLQLPGRPRPTAQVLGQIGDHRKLDGIIDGRWLLPSTGFIETICRAFHLHPFDALLTAEEVLQHSRGIRKRVCGDHLAKEVLVHMLGRLGHRWWTGSEIGTDIGSGRLSYDEVCGIVEAQVVKRGYAGVLDVCGVPLDDWVQRGLVESNHACFFGQSPLVFGQNWGRLGVVTRAAFE